MWTREVAPRILDFNTTAAAGTRIHRPETSPPAVLLSNSPGPAAEFAGESTMRPVTTSPGVL